MKHFLLILFFVIPTTWAADFAFNNDLSMAQENMVLPVNQAFHLEQIHIENNTIYLSWLIADGYYLYRDKTVLKAQSISLQTPQWPAGTHIKDKIFGDQIVYYQKLVLPIPFTPDKTVETASLTVTYQGCQEKGICYPPVTQTFSFNPNETIVPTQTPATQTPATQTPATQAPATQAPATQTQTPTTPTITPTPTPPRRIT